MGAGAGQAVAGQGAAPAGAVIAARNLDLTFQTGDGPVHALKGVSLDIRKGDFVSFIGPSGCGKTTFLRCIAGLEEPTGGSLSVNGMTPDAARRARAYGYVFQAAGLYPWRTIGRNVSLPLEIMGYGRAEIAERVARVLALVDLAGFEKKYPWQLSGGMQQRASIARALAFDADILLMDEPFGAVDPIVRAELQQELLRLQDEVDKTIVFVTHDIDEAFLLGDQVVILEKGAHIAQVGTPSEILENPASEFVASFIGADQGKRSLRLKKTATGTAVIDGQGRTQGMLSDPDESARGVPS